MTLVPEPGTLTELVQFLRQAGYLSTQRIPSQRRPLWKIVAEPQVYRDYTKGRTHCFSSSALPGSYMRSFLGNDPGLAVIYRLFFLNQPVPAGSAASALGGALAASLVRDGLLRGGETLRSMFRLVPWRNSLLLSDPDEGPSRQREHYVYVGGDSTLLADFVARATGSRRFERGLDLCAGTSIQAHTIIGQCGSVVAAEYNPRAVAFARVNAIINGLAHRITAVESNLWENVDGTFDIIVSNPPYLPMPEDKLSTSNLDVCGGCDYGMDIPVGIFRGMAEHLAGDGYGVFLAASPVIRGRSLLHERLSPLAKELGLSASLTAWNYTDLILDREYQRREGISYFVFYFVEVGRKGPSGIRTIHLPFYRRIPLVVNAAIRRSL